MEKYTNEKYYKSDVTARIIKRAQKVHKTLGSGFPEIIYQRALAVELLNEGLKFEKEKEMRVMYEGQFVGSRRVDFIVDGDIMVELKAVTKLEDVYIAQLLNYLEAYKVKLGLLLNFGAKSLEVKRFIK